MLRTIVIDVSPAGRASRPDVSPAGRASRPDVEPDEESLMAGSSDLMQPDEVAAGVLERSGHRLTHPLRLGSEHDAELRHPLVFALDVVDGERGRRDPRVEERLLEGPR